MKITISRTQVFVLAALVRRWKLGQKLIKAHDEQQKNLTEEQRWNFTAVATPMNNYVHDVTIPGANEHMLEALYYHGLVDVRRDFWRVTERGIRAVRKAKFNHADPLSVSVTQIIVTNDDLETGVLESEPAPPLEPSPRDTLQDLRAPEESDA